MNRLASPKISNPAGEQGGSFLKKKRSNHPLQLLTEFEEFLCRIRKTNLVLV
jgi:hypothetical protein